MADKPEAPATTPVPEWIIPNQDKLEQVIDARLAKHAESEGADKKSASTRSRTAASTDKEVKAEDPKS
jgi:hypothetical protein